jgi:hypothetical protein
VYDVIMNLTGPRVAHCLGLLPWRRSGPPQAHFPVLARCAAIPPGLIVRSQPPLTSLTSLTSLSIVFLGFSPETAVRKGMMGSSTLISPVYLLGGSGNRRLTVKHPAIAAGARCHSRSIQISFFGHLLSAFHDTRPNVENSAHVSPRQISLLD